MPNMPIHILGQGSIGSILTANGQLKGLNITQIVRAGSKNKNHEVKLGNQRHLLTTKKQLNEIEKVDFLIVPVKAYDIVTALTDIKPFLSEGAIVVISHNGLGTLKDCQNLLGDKANLYFCTTSTGAYCVEDVVHLSGIGNSQWSEVSECGVANNVFRNKSEVANVISTVFYNAQYVSNLLPILWKKLAVNAVINPITALYNIVNGAILEHEYQTQVDAVLLELIQVAEAEGINLPFTPLKALVLDVAHKTANNSSSMREDIIHGRQTEINFINGFIAQQAKRHGIATPINEHLVTEIKTLQRL
ncbi:2-dehydropantoate 2-reductase [Psychrosphaera sp.]|nr:2-dehydropantoate 2-reductase [Psychrosphaera sp.]